MDMIGSTRKEGDSEIQAICQSGGVDVLLT